MEGFHHMENLCFVDILCVFLWDLICYDEDGDEDDGEIFLLRKFRYT